MERCVALWWTSLKQVDSNSTHKQADQSLHWARVYTKLNNIGIIINVIIVDTCQYSFLTGDNKIPDSALTASSSYDPGHGPQRSRLNTLEISNDLHGGWSAANNDNSQWIQVNFSFRSWITYNTNGLGTDFDRELKFSHCWLCEIWLVLFVKLWKII